MLERRLRILLDTSFLLPTLGIGVEEATYRALKTLKSMRNTELYYLEEGLMEAIWVVIRFLDKIPLEVIEKGVEAIRRDYKVLYPDGRIIVEALKIYKLGHKDIIDALYYTTAKATNIKWLTIDKYFISFLEKQGYNVKEAILTPEKLVKTYGNQQYI